MTQHNNHLHDDEIEVCAYCDYLIDDTMFISSKDGRHWHSECFYYEHPHLDKTVPTDKQYNRRLL